MFQNQAISLDRSPGHPHPQPPLPERERGLLKASWRSSTVPLASHDGRSHVLILDELPYAVEADPAVLSALQHAWDQHFQHSQVRIFLCGS